MPKRQIETMITIGSDRSIPRAVLAQSAKRVQESGVVDYLHIWDQMVGWFPPPLWTPENAPLAAIFPDLDSFMDPYAAAAYAAAAAPDMGLTISTDSIRRGPAELQQTMMTLANLGNGKVVVQMGAGELKQTKAFGWKRSEGLKRLEDQMRFHQEFWRENKPADMQGNFWSFDKAWIGKTRSARPKIWALGGGPKLIELSTTYADGFATSAPVVGSASSPEQFASFVKQTKEVLESKGRDPEAFDFCLWPFVMIHEDKDVIERAFDNPLIRWMSAVTGRMNQAEWAAYGIESAFPPDWHYSMKYIPYLYNDRKEIDAILARTTHRMAELSCMHGTVDEVTNEIQAYVDAGATVVDMIDALGWVLDPAGAAASFDCHIEVCRRIKQRNS